MCFGFSLIVKKKLCDEGNNNLVWYSTNCVLKELGNWNDRQKIYYYYSTTNLELHIVWYQLHFHSINRDRNMEYNLIEKKIRNMREDIILPRMPSRKIRKQLEGLVISFRNATNYFIEIRSEEYQELVINRYFQ